MTCIVAVKNAHAVWIGADRSAFTPCSTTVRTDTKLFKRGSYVIGFTTSYRMGQLLRYAGELPEPIEGKDLYEFMVVDFIDAIRKIFKDGGFITKKDNTETGGQFLVAIKNRIFEIDSDFQVGESLDAYSAVGCGYQYALGAMHASYTKAPLDLCVQRALHAAEKLHPFVQGPFDVIEVKNDI